MYMCYEWNGGNRQLLAELFEVFFVNIVCLCHDIFFMEEKKMVA